MAAWIAALGAAVAAIAVAAAAWQFVGVLRRLKAWMEEAQSSGNKSLEQLDELLSDARHALRPAREAAEEARRQLMLLGPVLESALKLQDAANHAQLAARKLAHAAADTAESAAVRVEQAAGKYREQIDQAIGIAEVALEGWMFWRSRREKLGISACSGRNIGNPNEEGSD